MYAFRIRAFQSWAPLHLRKSEVEPQEEVTGPRSLHDPEAIPDPVKLMIRKASGPFLQISNSSFISLETEDPGC